MPFASAHKFFVYGTLKVGRRNHSLAQPHLVTSSKAYCWAKLYHLPQYDCPAIEIPPSLGKASGILQEDLQRFSAINEFSFKKPEGDWNLIEGELFELKNLETVMPILDELEGFLYDAAISYTREIICIKGEHGQAELAWVYPVEKLPSVCQFLTKSSW